MWADVWPSERTFRWRRRAQEVEALLVQGCCCLRAVWKWWMEGFYIRRIRIKIRYWRAEVDGIRAMHRHWATNEPTSHNSSLGWTTPWSLEVLKRCRHSEMAMDMGRNKGEKRSVGVSDLRDVVGAKRPCISRCTGFQCCGWLRAISMSPASMMHRISNMCSYTLFSVDRTCFTVLQAKWKSRINLMHHDSNLSMQIRPGEVKYGYSSYITEIVNSRWRSSHYWTQM